MKKIKLKGIFIVVIILVVGCEADFLDKKPIDTPSLDSFWETEEQAEMWVNNLYNGLGGVEEAIYEAYSDNAYGRAGDGANNIAKGTFEPNDPDVAPEWDYRYIRLSLEFFENVDRVPEMSPEKLDELTGQVNFMLAYRYYKLITFFRDVPLVEKPLSIGESDVPKNSKEEVLAYILNNLDNAIQLLPESWPESETGRITKGAALALKARVLLYNERWQEAADAAQQIIDLNEYELHPNFEEVFLQQFNNQTKEVILAKQYAEVVNTNRMVLNYAPVTLGGFALVLPTADLSHSFRMIDGLPITESPLFDPTTPFENRDPRHDHTILIPGEDLNGAVLDLTGREFGFARTYIYFEKYIADLENRNRATYVNWILFRYAEVLLNYAEAQNEATGPEDSIYEALDQIRERAGMPPVDRSKYNDQVSLRGLIRNERRVELAGEGLRYFDILRWGIAEETLNQNLTSMDLEAWEDGPTDDEGNPILIELPIEVRSFDPSKHYVWPVPQDAIDRSDNILLQHPEWE